jgi:hypothetical protein
MVARQLALNEDAGAALLTALLDSVEGTPGDGPT